MKNLAKIFLITAALFSSSLSTAQDLGNQLDLCQSPDKKNQYAHFTAQEILTVIDTQDLDGDGRKDVVLLTSRHLTKDEKNITCVKMPQHVGLLVALNKTEDWQIAAKSEELLSHPDFGGESTDLISPSIEVSNSKIRLGVSYLRAHWSFIFQLNSNKFRMIGFESISRVSNRIIKEDYIHMSGSDTGSVSERSWHEGEVSIRRYIIDDRLPPDLNKISNLPIFYDVFWSNFLPD